MDGALALWMRSWRAMLQQHLEAFGQDARSTAEPPSCAEERAQCPRCERRCPRPEYGHRTVCPPCSKSLRGSFLFCWACGREWQGPVWETSCSLPGCERRAALLSTETTTDRGSAVYGCPLFRACPCCEALLAHSGRGCNNIRCGRCRTRLCFRCLKTSFCPGACRVVDNRPSLALLGT
uniref:Si:ch211-284e13.12 n=1 Tax=Scleropages formosus TaxID=113540 RepID=A0A8C9TCM0_SCLFO